MEFLDKEVILDIIKEQKRYFHGGATRDIGFRINKLMTLKESIKKHEKEILEALYKDLRKSEFEAYSTEVGFVLDSISYFTRNLKKWAKAKRVRTPIHQFPSKTYIVHEPYGVSLIIGPFNYPFQLLIEPLIGAIAAGNCAVLKPSEAAPAVSKVTKKIIEETFSEEYVRVVEGEKETTSALIHSPFDYIFFTGSVPVGKIVMEAASKNLVPVTLELGGKSPTIVDKTAKLNVAAKRILWGKLSNAGQTCIAPDYVIVHSSVKQEFITELKKVVVEFYGDNPKESPDFGRMINHKQFDRLAAIIDKDRDKIIYGGGCNREDLYIEPTLIDNVTWEEAAMAEEIFGPILPIMEYEILDSVIAMINEKPKPLAVYVFTEDKNVAKDVMSRISFGGGCVNDTISHVASPYVPFGGVGSSGLGGYHGRYSFDTFSHKKSILKKGTKLKLELAFPPYKDKVKLAKRFLK